MARTIHKGQIGFGLPFDPTGYFTNDEANKHGGMMAWLDHIPLLILILLCATLGLAPFAPEPHIVEKLRMLFQGALTKPIDIFDFVMHGTPWVLLILKLIRMATARAAS